MLGVMELDRRQDVGTLTLWGSSSAHPHLGPFTMNPLTSVRSVTITGGIGIIVTDSRPNGLQGMSLDGMEV